MQYKFRLFSTDIGDMEEFEELMTKAFSGSEIEIIQKETKLTELGAYLVAVHWVETGNSSEDKRRIQELIDEGV